MSWAGYIFGQTELNIMANSFFFTFSQNTASRARIITKSINIDDYKNARACAYLYCESVG